MYFREITVTHFTLTSPPIWVINVPPIYAINAPSPYSIMFNFTLYVGVAIFTWWILMCQWCWCSPTQHTISILHVHLGVQWHLTILTKSKLCLETCPSVNNLYKSIARKLEAKQYTKKPHSLHFVQDIIQSSTGREANTALLDLWLWWLHLKGGFTPKLVSLIAYQWQGLVLPVTLSHGTVLTSQRMSLLSFKSGSHHADDLLISLQKLWSFSGKQR